MRAFPDRADLLAGGFLLTFASCLGQTWFIALSGPALRASLGLGHGSFGSLYSLATLASGLTLIWLGAKVDHVSVRRMALGVVVGLGTACLAMAAVDSPWLLLPVLFGLRLLGQGLMTHLSLTAMARAFPEARGRALSLASLGFPAGEALLPGLAVLALSALGWRSTWMIAGAVALLVLPPLCLVLLRRAPGPAAEAVIATMPQAALRRRDLLRSTRFALLLPA